VWQQQWVGDSACTSSHASSAPTVETAAQ
jgi:hypothetical protein